MLYAAVTDAILGAFFKVYNALGYGFLEKVYRNALAHELSSGGFNVVTEHPLKVYYRGVIVGEYFADVLVENKVVLELKSCESLCDEHMLQLMNYLKATGAELGLLLNFGRKPEFKRIIFSNDGSKTPRGSGSFSNKG